VVGLLFGIIEELGWTGFAIPMLRRRYGILAKGTIIGVVLVFSQLVVMPLTTGEATLTDILTWVAVLWIVVAAVTLVNHAQLS
jgi:hypothetical protein